MQEIVSLEESASGSALFSAAQVREADQRIIADGTPGLTLMERAGSAAFMAMRKRWPDAAAAVVLCGTGNNGGDGYILAHLAHQAGLEVTVMQLGECSRVRGDAKQALTQARSAGLHIGDWSAPTLLTLLEAPGNNTVVVDAMLGTGFHGCLQGDYADAVAILEASRTPILALDIPSGVDANTGQVSGPAVQAQLTVTFIGRKQGLFTGQAPAHTGEVLFASCGAQMPADIQPAARIINAELARHVLRPRSRTAHKGDAGNVLVVGGDTGFGGAALLTAEAAARSGAGTVSLLTRAAHVSPALSRRPELMAHGIEDVRHSSDTIRQLVSRASVVVAGPGLGQSAWSQQLLQQVLSWATAAGTPVVLDADALNLLAQEYDFWRSAATASARAGWVLTPHPGEAARLLGLDTQTVQADRFAAIQRLQAHTGAVCLLKGAGSLLAFPADDFNSCIDVCTEGNPGMATGGMGDVLAGIIAALRAQGLSAADALRCAVCVHGEAADLAAAAAGERGLLALDILPHVRKLLN